METISQSKNVSEQQQVGTILFVLGPSGVGKSTVSKGLFDEHLFLHIDIDQKKGFKKNGFPEEWDRDFDKLEITHLATVVHERLANEQRTAAVLSFPTIHVFSPEQLKAASFLGIDTVVLWGSKEFCMEARRIRSKKNHKKFDLERYHRNNKRSFEIYCQSEYSGFRIEVFRPDGTHWPLEQLLKLIMERISS